MNKNLGILPSTTLNQPVTENLGIRIRILEPMFIDETRTKNTKNSQNMRVKGINLTIVLIIKTLFGLLVNLPI